jgi:hypothetical protein
MGDRLEPGGQSRRATDPVADPPLRACCEYDLLAVTVADLGEHHLKRANLVTSDLPHMAAVDGEGNRMRRSRRCGRLARHRLLLQASATLMVRRRVVSTAGTSPSGRNSDSNVRARRYGSKDPILAMTHSYSGGIGRA